MSDIFELSASRLSAVWTQVKASIQPGSGTLLQAMDYSMAAGGKRLRPALAWGACQSLARPIELADRAAIAVEMIHCYSLIHDDLPAMDDDDLRRGQPSCHIAFGEAQAILAGDALNTLAFQALADPSLNLLPLASLPHAITTLARCAGPEGMVDGQSLDLLAEGLALERSQLEQIHRRKTAALIRASAELGGLAGQADSLQLSALIEFAETLGLAFQVQDDILDITSTSEQLGKPAGSDVEQDKATYVELLGLSGAQSLVGELFEAAQESALQLPNPDPLQQILSKLVQRQA